jgi:sugar phosphate isomerase/epimerase
MKKLGLSIPWNFLAENPASKDAVLLADNFGNPVKFLSFLKDLEVVYIELRHRSTSMSPDAMKKVFRLLSDFGFGITIHGDNPPAEADWTVHTVFPWLSPFSAIYPEPSEKVTVTLHPYNGPGTEGANHLKTVSFIRRLSEGIKEKGLPVSLALENQRSKGFVDPGTTFSEIKQMHSEINRAACGICWDMGHCLANFLRDRESYKEFPGNAFTSAVTHTHIHDIGPDGRTHWPFTEHTVPVAENVKLLKNSGYDGIYNLELSFERFSEVRDQQRLLRETITELSSML